MCATSVLSGVAGSLLRLGRIDIVLFGADRVASNGDVVNKIGTFPLSVLAHEHGVPVYAVVPTSTIDLECENGDVIEIEERSGDEVTGLRFVVVLFISMLLDIFFFFFLKR